MVVRHGAPAWCSGMLARSVRVIGGHKSGHPCRRGRLVPFNSIRGTSRCRSCPTPPLPTSTTASTDYLLSPTHPKGRVKAAFFLGFGFSLSDWTVLRDTLLDHARLHDAVAQASNRFGTKYIISGPLRCPDGRLPIVKAAWIIDAGQSAPRFVSAVAD